MTNTTLTADLKEQIESINESSKINADIIYNRKLLERALVALSSIDDLKDYKMVARQARDYVKATKCKCDEFTKCWKCLFEYNLNFIDEEQ